MAIADSDGPTYSVSFRSSAQTIEFAFVSVAVSADLINRAIRRTGRIDGAKMVSGRWRWDFAPDLRWQQRGSAVQSHPIQMPPPGLL